jgi:hypothetical protein
MDCRVASLLAMTRSGRKKWKQMETTIDAMIHDADCAANLLNEAGIITVFNSFGTGI